MSYPTQKVVVITGGGSGIGAAVAARYAAQGDQVVLVGRRLAPLQQVAASTGALVLTGDAASAEDWAGIVFRILEAFGRIDVLVTSAGSMTLGKVTDTRDEDWHSAIQGNLNTAFASARACLPELIKTQGNIVFIASIASLAAGPEVCGYVTAKHALIGLMRSIARDYGPLGVRANAICPGWVTTPMADEEMQPVMDAWGLDLAGAYAKVTRDVPLRRAASPDEIARVCLFLASDAASIVTGATLVADGGSTIVDVPTLAFADLP
ncbi:SDR family NAD(P)-dependent oxidoreductase [Leeia oryzae]|uniref:SDR family NAD(P)-dependent oxidoreductase n=1 Tax=Leeia oryzae TaxID=356662 RepID=UPI0003734A72|nr:SDR family oxidoreductase [Leeia oryzae]